MPKSHLQPLNPFVDCMFWTKKNNGILSKTIRIIIKHTWTRHWTRHPGVLSGARVLLPVRFASWNHGAWRDGDFIGVFHGPLASMIVLRMIFIYSSSCWNIYIYIQLYDTHTHIYIHTHNMLNLYPALSCDCCLYKWKGQNPSGWLLSLISHRCLHALNKPSLIHSWHAERTLNSQVMPTIQQNPLHSPQ